MRLASFEKVGQKKQIYYLLAYIVIQNSHSIPEDPELEPRGRSGVDSRKKPIFYSCAVVVQRIDSAIFFRFSMLEHQNIT
jgi:hypothetical protein